MGARSRRDRTASISSRSEPVGPVAAFTPWNFPINQAVRKSRRRFAAGCSIIIKGPEETPAACAGLIDAYVKAGVPAGVVNLVFAVPGDISSYLIPHPTIGKSPSRARPRSASSSRCCGPAHEARHHGARRPRARDRVRRCRRRHAVKILSANKFRNAGQVCVAPTRFMVQKPVYDEFVGNS